MVDSALVWVSLTTVVSVIGVVAVAYHYVRTTEFRFKAFAVAVVFGGYGLELAVTNDYRPGNTLLGPAVGVLAIIAVVVTVVSLVGSNRLQRWFQGQQDDLR